MKYTPFFSALLAIVAACVVEDPGGSGDTGGPPPWVEPPPAVNDGMGEGFYQVPLMEDNTQQGVFVGAPQASVNLPGVGVVSVFGKRLNSPLLETPSHHSERYYEDGNSTNCARQGAHQFAWDEATATGYGDALTFYSVLGASLANYITSLVVGAPNASGTDGRVLMHWGESLGCKTCSLFSNAPPLDPVGGAPLEGDEFETEFGAAVALGVFHGVDTSGVAFWRASARESLLVGAPQWQSGGGVHIFHRDGSDADYRWYEDGSGSSGNLECNRRPGVPQEIALRNGHLTGVASTAEFGRSLAVADFTCDGYDDVAIGAPGADLTIGLGTTIDDAGAVLIYTGGPAGVGVSGSIMLYQGIFGTEGEPEAGDRFGEVLSVANVNGRRIDVESPDPAWSCWDLIVGTPGEGNGTGEVQVFYGDSMDPAAAGPILRVGEGGIPGTAAPGDRFGAALMGFNLDAGGFDELIIGAPGIGSGRVFMVPGSGTGPNTNATLELSQLEVMGEELGDDFGSALGAYRHASLAHIVIGIPGEDGDEGAIEVRQFQADLSSSIVGRWTAADGGFTQNQGDRWGSKILQPRAFVTRPWAP